MNTQTRLLRKTAIAAAVTLLIGGVASLNNFEVVQTGMSSIVSSAYAAQGDSGGCLLYTSDAADDQGLV